MSNNASASPAANGRSREDGRGSPSVRVEKDHESCARALRAKRSLKAPVLDGPPLS